MDTAREVMFSERRHVSNDSDAEEDQLLAENTPSYLGPEDREATSAPLPPEDEVDEDAYYDEISQRSWQVIKRIFIGSAAVAVIAIVLIFKSNSWPRWHSEGKDVVGYQASLSGMEVCGAIYCPLGGSAAEETCAVALMPHAVALGILLPVAIQMPCAATVYAATLAQFAATAFVGTKTLSATMASS
eukprot:CAMPEP_0197638886 /NCGR_PEP_ID=MMETSP1338-20131121/13677_1 /TAXON_ID=43686 ORGANISM="Pelagodinium beii, Strain RCC1491" /NCGR_SAMPLE_ID=MMETSP1338 /ASSEMBLY_ACC=CAM_ASM_000754 /LENGTH=186 /DNA_ID=CAMNT_0043211539 /DNA_START=52 /DNA_END=613 /DNA_ORIENTATION=-